jgi:predicted nicotinamide N-methyase
MLRARDALAIFRDQGAAAAVRFGVAVVRASLRQSSSTPRTNRVDEQFGTDTAENMKLHDLDIHGPNYRYGVFYRATNLSVLHDVLARLPVCHSECTFLDYGSGKGLVLLQAAGYPFKKVIGVEFARELHETARENVERYPADLRKSAVELVHGDVIEFQPPEGNLVIYLYEPFEAPLTKKVIARIDELRRRQSIVIAYVWSKNEKLSSRLLWEGASFLTRCDQGDCWTIYRASPNT